MAVCSNCEKTVGIIFYDRQTGLCRDCQRLDGAKTHKDRLAEEVESYVPNNVAQAVHLSAAAKRTLSANIIITTAPTLDGFAIVQTLDVVGAQAAMGMNMFKDIAHAIRDTVGGRSESLQSSMRQARKLCLDELRDEALLLGGDAVIAVHFEYSQFTSSAGGGMLLVVATGTAVKIAELSDHVEIAPDSPRAPDVALG